MNLPKNLLSYSWALINQAEDAATQFNYTLQSCEVHQTLASSATEAFVMAQRYDRCYGCIGGGFISRKPLVEHAKTACQMDCFFGGSRLTGEVFGDSSYHGQGAMEV